MRPLYRNLLDENMVREELDRDIPVVVKTRKEVQAQLAAGYTYVRCDFEERGLLNVYQPGGNGAHGAWWVESDHAERFVAWVEEFLGCSP